MKPDEATGEISKLKLQNEIYAIDIYFILSD
jgi:hypothetical protein